MITAKAKNAEEYIAAFPKKTQLLLKQMRATIKKAAPDAEEVISYGMPGYKLGGMLVYFAGYEHHIGFYAAPTGNEAFKNGIIKLMASWSYGLMSETCHLSPDYCI